MLACRSTESANVDFLPGASYTQAVGINEKGEFAGAYDDVDGTTHGYVAR